MGQAIKAQPLVILLGKRVQHMYVNTLISDHYEIHFNTGEVPFRAICCSYSSIQPIPPTNACTVFLRSLIVYKALVTFTGYSCTNICQIKGWLVPANGIDICLVGVTSPVAAPCDVCSGPLQVITTANKADVVEKVNNAVIVVAVLFVTHGAYQSCIQPEHLARLQLSHHLWSQAQPLGLTCCLLQRWVLRGASTDRSPFNLLIVRYEFDDSCQLLPVLRIGCTKHAGLM